MPMETCMLTVLAAALTLGVAIWHNPVPTPDSVFDYCSIPCVDYRLSNKSSGNNTACWNAKCPRQPNVIELPWNFAARNAIHYIHNDFRDWLGQDAAAPPHFSALSYDIELEFLMACWLNRGLVKNDDCRSCKRWDFVAQLLLTYDISDDPFSYENLRKPILEYWMKYKITDPWTPASTIMGWMNSTHMGCYAVALNDSGKVLLGCNYAPGGGVPNEKVYDAGENAKCPNDTKVFHGYYKRLCRAMKFWPYGSGYVGNVLLEQRKAYWEREFNRIKNGEEDYSAGCTLACELGITPTLLYCACVLLKLLARHRV